MVKDFLPRTWELQLTIIPLGDKSTTLATMSNILHATIGGDSATYGDRTPSIYFLPKSTRLFVCSAVFLSTKYCRNIEGKELPFNQETNVVVRKIKKLSGKYFFQVLVNNEMKVDAFEYVGLTREFRNVKYYAADPWAPTAYAKVKNFRLITGKQFNLYILLVDGF